MKTAATFIVFLGLMLAVPALRAQDADPGNLAQSVAFDAVSKPAPSDSGPSDSDAAAAADDPDYFRFRMAQQRSAPIYAGILALTAIIAHLSTLRFLARMNGAASYVVSVTALIYVVFGTILLVVIATTEAQLTAAMGILGAVAGYIFGKTRREGVVDDARKAAPPGKMATIP